MTRANEVKCEKVVRNGKVAVLISPGFGAGWSSWGTPSDFMLFDRRFVECVEAGGHLDGRIDSLIKEIFGDEYICTLGAGNLKIEWIDEGSPFYVHEYDGNEWIVTSENDAWHIA